MNQNNIIFAWLGALTVLTVVLFYFQFANNQKLVYIDSNRLLAGYQGMKDAQSKFQKKSLTWKANVDTLMSEVQRSIMDYEKESPKMTTREKELSRELIKTKQKQLAATHFRRLG